MPNTCVFIRTKYIKGNPYAYLVENEWKKGGARQKVSGYLGRIYEQEETAPPTLPDDADAIISSLIDQEVAIEVDIDLKERTVRKDGNKAVVALNGGYLCDYTLENLFKALHQRNEERPGTALAEAFARAGLRIPQHAFIKLYKHHRP